MHYKDFCDAGKKKSYTFLSLCINIRVGVQVMCMQIRCSSRGLNSKHFDIEQMTIHKKRFLVELQS